MVLRSLSSESSVHEPVNMHSAKASAHFGTSRAKHAASIHPSAFCLLAAVLFSVQVLSSIQSLDEAASVLLILRALAACLALALVGWLPMSAGAACGLLIGLGASLPPEEAQLDIVMIGLYLVAAEWISRSRYGHAAILVILVEGAQIRVSGNPAADLAGLSLGAAMALAAGLSLHRHNQKVASLGTQVQEARHAQAQARSRVYHDLAVALHSTVAADLSHIIIASETLTRRTRDSFVDSELRSLAETSRTALCQLRSLMSDAGVGARLVEDTLLGTISSCATMLHAGGIELEPDVPEDIDATWPRATSTLLASVVREGATNALKNAPAGSAVELSIRCDGGGAARLVMINQVRADRPSRPDPLSGGAGLPWLDRCVRKSGGTLTFGSNAGVWLLIVGVPIPSGVHHEIRSSTDSDRELAP